MRCYGWAWSWLRFAVQPHQDPEGQDSHAKNSEAGVKPARPKAQDHFTGRGRNRQHTETGRLGLDGDRDAVGPAAPAWILGLGPKEAAGRSGFEPQVDPAEPPLRPHRQRPRVG